MTRRPDTRKRARPQLVQRADFKVQTYHHSWLPVERHTDANEYGPPNVQVMAEVDGSQLSLSLGPRTPDAEVNPAVLAERQTDRWVVVLHSHDGADAEVLVYILDDGRVVVVPESTPSAKNLEFAKISPPPLPAKQCRYPVPKTSRQKGGRR